MKENGDDSLVLLSLRRFQQSTNGQKRMTREEEKELATKISENQDVEESVVKLTTANIGLAIYKAKKYRDMGVEFEDLVHAAILGLVVAAHKFIPDKGAKFSTYAKYWIMQKVYLALAGARFVKMPPYAVTEMLYVRKVSAKLSRELGRELSSEEVHPFTKLSLMKVKRYLSEMVHSVESLDGRSYFRDGDDLCKRYEHITDGGEDPFEILCKKEESEMSRVLLEKLPPNFRDVLIRRLDLDDKGFVETSSEVGKSYGLTGACIRLQQEQALEILAKILGHRLKIGIIRKSNFKIRSKKMKKERVRKRK